MTRFHSHLNGFKHRKWLYNSTWHIYGTLTGAITPGQSGSGSNDNEGVLLIPQSFRTWTSTSGDLDS